MSTCITGEGAKLKTYYVVMLDTLVETDTVGVDGAIGNIRATFHNHLLDGEVFNNYPDADVAWSTAKSIDKGVIIKKVTVSDV